MNTELLPCPFCGGSPRYLEAHTGFYSERIICDSCDYSLPHKFWQRRTNPISAQSVVEILERVKDGLDDSFVTFPEGIKLLADINAIIKQGHVP